MKNMISIVILAGISYLYGFEINTHQAITRCALTEECGMQKISNLENFVGNTELNTTNTIYENEVFDKYTKTYKVYANEGDGFNDWNISITPNYHGMIEAGSVLEDSAYHNAEPKPLYFEAMSGSDGRFNNHFYGVQLNTRVNCSLPNSQGLMLTTKTLCVGYGKRTDAIDWIFNEHVTLGLDRTNEYGLENAFEYMKKSFEGNEAERRKYQAKFFVTLGMMSHMLQDLHSPAHVKDGSHGMGDYLEIYGRYDKGFNLRQGNMNPSNEQEISNAISSFDMPSYLTGMNFKSLEDFYYKEARWVSENFFSEAHNSKEKTHLQTGEGLFINNFWDKDTIFDGSLHLSTSETHTVEAPNQWNYIKTNGKVGSIYGPIVTGSDTVAMEDEGILFGLGRSEHMLKPTEYTIKRNALNEPIELEPSDPVNTYTNADTTALKHTAINVIPRAVASTQAMLNFFFRGQIKASTIYTRSIWVFNLSDTTQISDTNLLTFKTGGKFYFYYMNDDKISKSIAMDASGEAVPYLLEEDFLVNTSKLINLNTLNDYDTTGDIFEGKEIDAETRWIVVYEGEIGEDLGGSNNFGYGMKGMSVDIALDRFRRGDTNETVIDYANNIEWQDTTITLRDAWYPANSYCNNLVLAGYDDWSLPTSSQLLSIVKHNGDSYLYKNIFEHWGEVGYWSINFHHNYPLDNTVTVVSYDTGVGSEIAIHHQMNTRCVRNK